MYGKVRDFVGSQYGIVGQAIGQRVAETALRDFASQGIADLPAETRVALSPTLRVTSETIARSGVNVLTALTQARVDLRQEIDTKVQATGGEQIGKLGDRIGSLEGVVAGKLDTAVHDRFQGDIDASLATLTGQARDFATQVTSVRDVSNNLLANFTTLQGSFKQLDTRLGTLQTSFGQLDGRLTTAQSDLASQIATKAATGDLSSLQTSFSALQSTFGQLDTRLGGVQTSLSQLDGRLTTVQTDITKQIAGRASVADLKALQDKTASTLQAKVDATALDQLRTQMTDQLATKAAAGELKTLQDKTTAALQAKADGVAVDQLRIQMTDQLATKAAAGDLKALQDKTTAALQAKADATALDQLRTQMTGQIAGKADKTDFANLVKSTDARFADLTSSATKLTQQMEDFNRSVVQLDERIGAFQRNINLQMQTNLVSIEKITANLDQLQVKLGDLSTNLGGRLTSVETFTTRVTTDLTQVQGSLGGLNRDFTSFRKRINDSGLLRPP